MLTVDIEKTPFYKIGNEEGRKEGLQEGLQEGIEKGMEKGVLLVAKQMLKAKMELATIQKVTNLSIEQLQELQKEL